MSIVFQRVGGSEQENEAGVILFLIPFCVLMIIVAWPAVYNSWSVLEMSPDPGGLPRYPIKTVIPIAFLLILAQGISMGIHQIDILLRRQVHEQDGREEVD